MAEKTQDTKDTIKSNLTIGFVEAHQLGEHAQLLRGNVHRVDDGGRPFVILERCPGSFEVHALDGFGSAPDHLESTVTLSDAGSFIKYVNDFKDSGSRIFALFGDTGGKFRAVLDYHHDPMQPRWGKHVAVYTCPTTPEWDRWIKLNAQMLAQADFSDFVEDQRLAFVTPDVATMLEIARTLEASQTGKFESNINPTNGNKTLVYKDEVNATAGGSAKLTIPSSITVRLQPFRRGSTYQLEARLLYRIRDGKVSFQYQLVRAHEIIEIALKEISAQIVDKVGITPYNGTL